MSSYNKVSPKYKKSQKNAMNNYLYVNKLNNLQKINKFLETYNPSRLNPEGTENLKMSITNEDIQSVI